MVATVMLVNPRPRRKAAAAPKRKRKMSALQRQYFGGKRSRTPRAKPSAGSHIMSVQQNPKRRRRHAAKRTTVRYRRNPSRSGGSMSLLSTLGPAAIGAGGAIAVGYIAQNYLSSIIPANMTTGISGAVVMGGLGLLAGWGAGKAFGRKTGNAVAAGAVTIAIYNAISPTMGVGGGASSGGFLSSLFGGTGAGSYAGNYNSGALAGLARRNRRMGRYVQGAGMNGMLPPGLNGNTPRNLNGVAGPQQRQRMMRQRKMAGLGYMGPGRVMGAGPVGQPGGGQARRVTPAMRQLGRYLPRS